MPRGPLRRSRNDRMIGGVCGGLAEYFEFSSSATRLIYVLVSVCSSAFPGIIVYLILWVLIPLEERPAQY